VLPGDLSASRRYWDEDVVEPEVEVTPQGTIQIPQSAGLGYAVRRDLIAKLTVQTEIWQS
jgi:O-succinylbenzoate synthase